MAGTTAVSANGLGRNWGWLCAFGIGVSLLGLVALGSMVMATLATVVFFGSLLIAAGALQVVMSLWSRGWDGFWIHLLLGVLYLIVGGMIISRPVNASAAITLLIAIYLMVGGGMRIVAGFVGAYRHRFWIIVNGLINVVLGGMIYNQLPDSGFWVIGLFVGIDLLFAGASLVALALTIRRVGHAA